MSIRQKLSVVASALKYLAKVSDYSPYRFLIAANRYAYLYRKRRFSPVEIEMFNEADPNIHPDHIHSVYSNEEHLDLQKILNPIDAAKWVENKEIFYRKCLEHNLPHPTVHAVLDRVGLKRLTSRENNSEMHLLDELKDGEYIFKPTHGVHGEGVVACEKRGGLFYLRGQHQLPPDRIFQHLRSTFGYQSYLLQSRIRNHLEIREFSGSPTLQTARINTIAYGEDDIDVVYASFRMTTGDGVSDNFNFGTTGNSLWPVNVTSGKISKMYCLSPIGYGLQAVEPGDHRYPGDSSLTLPFWRQSKELVKRAAKHFYPLVTVGWDVAITDEGPKLIEANAYWDHANGMEEYRDSGLYQTLTAMVADRSS